MSYEVKTNTPIDAVTIEKLASTAYERAGLAENGWLDYEDLYDNENWFDFGFEYAVKTGNFDVNDWISTFWESEPGESAMNNALEEADKVSSQEFERLYRQQAEIEGADPAEADAQLETELENIHEGIEIDMSKQIEDFTQAITDWLNDNHLTATEAETLADAFDSDHYDYNIYRTGDIVETITDRFSGDKDAIVEVLMRAWQQPAEDFENLPDQDFEKALTLANPEDLAEAFANEIDAYYQTGYVVEVA